MLATSNVGLEPAPPTAKDIWEMLPSPIPSPSPVFVCSMCTAISKRKLISCGVYKDVCRYCENTLNCQCRVCNEYLYKSLKKFVSKKGWYLHVDCLKDAPKSDCSNCKKKTETILCSHIDKYIFCEDCEESPEIPSDTFQDTHGITRKFGVEIECVVENEGYNTSFFYVKAAGSIRFNDPEMGEEHASMILQGDNGLRIIRNEIDILKNESNAVVNSSCGLHVHIDARDFNGNHLLHLGKIIASHEPLIYALCASRRKDNTYCRPFRFFPIDLKDITSRTFGRYLEGVSRYHGTNFKAFDKFKTIEFRYHQGMLNADKIVDWVIFCLHLMERAKVIQGDEEILEEKVTPTRDKVRDFLSWLEVPERVIRSLMLRRSLDAYTSDEPEFAYITNSQQD